MGNRHSAVKYLTSIALLLLAAGCGMGNRPRAVAELRGIDGTVIGTAELQERCDGVVVRLNVQGLPPGLHGTHIHEQPVCTAPDFLSAGAHFDHSGVGHDHSDPAGHHAGDLPNLEVGSDGRGTLEALIPGVSLTGDGSHSLFRNGGTSLLIHENEDDGTADPSGNAGARIACGVVVPVS